MSFISSALWGSGPFIQAFILNMMLQLGKRFGEKEIPMPDSHFSETRFMFIPIVEKRRLQILSFPE